ncbi:MAG: AAA family ATPase, partial [Candidatus Baltobacteraceae bacterium]
MLRRLEIESYGLIARAEVDFASGATIFTGETGSGKTMLLGALDFVLGARAGADAVRRGSPKASVTLEFDPDDALRGRLASDGFELDRGENGTIVREMSEAGRSSVRVNGRPSTAGYVRDIGESIAEVVGQHEAQRLLSPAYHLELLDRFAGAAGLRLRDAVAAAYERAQEAAGELAALSQDERLQRERYDDALFAAREIEEARVEPGEVERLNERRRYLDNVERIALALRAAHDALAAHETNAAESIATAAASLASIAAIGPQFAEMAERAAALQAQADDLALDLYRALDATEFEPAELETINGRLDLLERLKRKYGGELDGVLAYAQSARQTIDAYESRDQRVAQAKAKSAAVGRELAEAAAALTALRKESAAKLGKRVRAEFGEIALGSGRFEVAVETLDAIAARGAERVEFLFAANA